MNVAILGPGGIAGDQHVPAMRLHPGVQLWSVLSRSLDRATAFADQHGFGAPRPAYTRLEDLLDDPDLDAVIVATPDRFHAEQVIACARAGKHVLLEKPMATSLDECDRMIAECAKNGVVLALAYHLRWHGGHRLLQPQLGQGLIGTLRHCRVHWTFSAADASNWRSAPETGRWWSLAANGTHCLDLIRWMMGPTEGEIRDVRALISRSKFQSPHDETAIVALGFESGATAEFCVSVQFASASRIELYGDTGGLRMEDTMGRHGRGEINLNGKSVTYDHANPFLGELNDFVESIRTGKSPEVSPEEGRRNVEVLLRIMEASGADRYS